MSPDRKKTTKTLPIAPSAYERSNEQRTRSDIEGALAQINRDIETNTTTLNTLIATLTTRGVLP